MKKKFNSLMKDIEEQKDEVRAVIAWVRLHGGR
jgi:hypothetical protein